LIEYYAVDKLGNKEEVKAQCIFVDKTPPFVEIWFEEPYEVKDDGKWITS